MRTIITCLAHSVFACLLCLLLIFPAITFAQPLANTPPIHPDGAQLIKQSVSAMSKINKLTGKLVTWERFYNSASGDYGDVNFQIWMKPHEVKLLAFLPEGDKGTRLHFKDGTNKNQTAIRKPAPLIDTLGISLDPEGKKLVNNAHHSMLTLGFKLAHNILAKAIKDHGADFDQYVTYVGKGKRFGRNCHEVKLEFKDWGWESYTMEKTESLLDLERRVNLSAYLIAEKNEYMVYETIKAGTKLTVPNAFAKTTTLYIDETNLLPIGQIMYDERGVFEKYEFKNLKIN